MSAYADLSVSAPSSGISSDDLADLMGTGAIGGDVAYNPGFAPVVPDTSGIDLPGQFVSIPGGGVSNGGIFGSDPSGVNMLYTDPGVNPTPTGGYMSALAGIMSSAAQGFSTYVKGSPSVAIPASRTPLGSSIGGGLLTNQYGQTNWTFIIGVVLVAGLGIWAVTKYA